MAENKVWIISVSEKNAIVLWNNDVQTFVWYAVEVIVVQTILETKYYLMNFNMFYERMFPNTYLWIIKIPSIE